MTSLVRDIIAARTHGVAHCSRGPRTAGEEDGEAGEEEEEDDAENEEEESRRPGGGPGRDTVSLATAAKRWATAAAQAADDGVRHLSAPPFVWLLRGSRTGRGSREPRSRGAAQRIKGLFATTQQRRRRLLPRVWARLPSVIAPANNTKTRRLVHTRRTTDLFRPDRTPRCARSRIGDAAAMAGTVKRAGRRPCQHKPCAELNTSHAIAASTRPVSTTAAQTCCEACWTRTRRSGPKRSLSRVRPSSRRLAQRLARRHPGHRRRPHPSPRDPCDRVVAV